MKFDLIEIINDESNMVLSGMSYDEIKLNELTISHSYSIDVRDYAARITSETGVVSPVLYLKSTVKITGGTGSYDNPYILN